MNIIIKIGLVGGLLGVTIIGACYVSVEKRATKCEQKGGVLVRASGLHDSICVKKVGLNTEVKTGVSVKTLWQVV
jgi:hypothetical protein